MLGGKIERKKTINRMGTIYIYKRWSWKKKSKKENSKLRKNNQKK